MDVKEFKKIDAHAHIGEFGGWAKLENTAEDLIAQMDEYNIEKIDYNDENIISFIGVDINKKELEHFFK